MVFKRVDKNHLLDIGLILLLVFIVTLNIAPFFSWDKLPFLDPTTGQVPRILAFKESVKQFGDLFPMWNPYLNGGEPIHDGIFAGIDSLIGILVFIFPTFTGIGLAFTLPVVFSAVTMYVLARYLWKERWVAFLVALTYSSAGYIITMLVTSSIHQVIGYAMTPLVILFTLKTLREKSRITNAVITGVLLGLQIRLAVDLKITLFLAFVIGSLFLTHIIGPDIKKRAINFAILGAIILIIGAGISADKMLTLKETIDASSRFKLTYEESSLRNTPLSQFFEVAIQPLKAGFNVRYDSIELKMGRNGWFAMGIVATLLAAVGIWLNFKNKIVMGIALSLLFCVLVVTASPFFYFLWKFIPPWGSFRYVERGFSIWSLGIALAMGYGILSLSARIRTSSAGKNISQTAIAFGIGLLLILNIFIFTRAPTPIYFCPVEKLLAENQVWKYVSEQPGIFRVHEWETRGIDWPADPYTAYYGLEHLYGYTSTWVPTYLGEFLVAAQQSPAKFWGIMNVKYVSAQQELNADGLKHIKTFEPMRSVSNCPPQEELRSYGPFLYENERVIPRAYIAHHAILFLGNPNSIQTAYRTIAADEFHPNDSIIVMSTNLPVQKMSPQELERFDAIILGSPDAIDAQSMGVLQVYKQNGGQVYPDILEGKTVVEGTDLLRALNVTVPGEALDDSAITKRSFSDESVSLPKTTPGFLVLSERFFYFKGWKAFVDGKEAQLYRANGFVTAIPIDAGASSVRLTYSTAGQKIGTLLTISTIVLIIAFFALITIKKIRP